MNEDSQPEEKSHVNGLHILDIRLIHDGLDSRCKIDLVNLGESIKC